MKKTMIRAVTLILLIGLLAVPTFASQVLVPVGKAVGLELEGEGLFVAQIDKTLGQRVKKAGLQEGDLIVKVDGQKVTDAQALRDLVSRCKEELIITVLRDGKEKNLTLMPEEREGEKRLGIFVREGITGVGTVTYYDPSSGRFGALGHGVSDGHGTILPIRRGNVLEAEVAGVKKGRSGAPGQLVGAFQDRKILGELERNTPCGVFGKASNGWPGTPLPVAQEEEIHTGPATIMSTISDSEIREYSVEILKLYPDESLNGRNLLLHVTDEALLKTTGGIVQGMSGSPIIQDGKLVGAVTHVLVNDPTTGYGIFIENMLDAAA